MFEQDWRRLKCTRGETPSKNIRIQPGNELDAGNHFADEAFIVGQK
jgi:hypothetical protein